VPENLTPAAWLELLERRLDERWKRMSVYDAYYEGDQELRFASQKWTEAFGSTFGIGADNWMPLVVDSSVERLKVQGFRYGSAEDADAEAWAIWQENGLDAEVDMLHTETVKLGEGYWLVQPPDGDGAPRIWAEHPAQTIVAVSARNRRMRLAALKKWYEEDGLAYATLYLPEQIVKYVSSGKVQLGRPIQWTRRNGTERNPLGVVPVVPMRNNPTLLGGGRSDLQDLLHDQNALNKQLADAMISSEYIAFPQRVAMGITVPRDPITGRPLAGAELQAMQSRLWVFESQDAKIGEFSAADLENYVKFRRHLIDGLTAKSRTPPHYVAGSIVNASGDALKAAETGLVAKVEKKKKPFGEAHEEAIALAFKSINDTERAKVTDAETIWGDSESRTFGELIDGLVKLATIGVPQKVLWQKAGFSPQEIARMETMHIADGVFNLIPPTPPTPPGAAPGRRWRQCP
jgi:hypothetical protein